MRNLFVCVDQTNCFSFPLLFLCDRSEFGLILAYFYLCDRTDFFASSKKVHDFITIVIVFHFFWALFHDFVIGKSAQQPNISAYWHWLFSFNQVVTFLLFQHSYIFYGVSYFFFVFETIASTIPMHYVCRIWIGGGGVDEKRKIK